MPAPLPLSRSQIEKLGKRLVASERPAREDLLLLHELQIAYRDVLSAAAERVRSNLPYVPVSRVKTQGTTIDKLRLNGGSWLSSIQDLAGMRIVADVTRGEQDALVSSLVALFADEPRAPKVIDRRASPSSGYRAVHVVAYPGGVQVEIQVRTRWQHQWAEMYERLADRLGRGIRYGQPPVVSAWSPELVEPLRNFATAAVEAADLLSELIDAFEEAAASGHLDPERRTRFLAQIASTMEQLENASTHF